MEKEKEIVVDDEEPPQLVIDLREDQKNEKPTGAIPKQTTRSTNLFKKPNILPVPNRNVKLHSDNMPSGLPNGK